MNDVQSYNQYLIVNQEDFFGVTQAQTIVRTHHVTASRILE